MVRYLSNSFYLVSNLIPEKVYGIKPNQKEAHRTLQLMEN